MASPRHPIFRVATLCTPGRGLVGTWRRLLRVPRRWVALPFCRGRRHASTRASAAVRRCRAITSCHRAIPTLASCQCNLPKSPMMLPMTLTRARRRCIQRRVHTYKMAEYLSAAAAEFVCGMLQCDERRRWEAARLARSAAFFAAVPWEALLARKITAPRVPSLRGPADTSQFSHVDLRRDGDLVGVDVEGEPPKHAVWEGF